MELVFYSPMLRGYVSMFLALGESEGQLVVNMRRRGYKFTGLKALVK